MRSVDVSVGPEALARHRLTNIGIEQRKLLDSWCTHVEQAITDASLHAEPPWAVAVHTPLAWSASMSASLVRLCEVLG